MWLLMSLKKYIFEQTVMAFPSKVASASSTAVPTPTTTTAFTLEHVLRVLDFPPHAHEHQTTAPLQAVLALDTIFEPDSPFGPFVLTGSVHHVTFAILVNQARGVRTHTCYNTRGGMSRQDVLLDQRQAWTATAAQQAFLERVTVFELWVQQTNPHAQAFLATLTSLAADLQAQRIHAWLAAQPTRQQKLQEVVVLEQSIRVKRGKAATLVDQRHFVLYGLVMELPQIGSVVQEGRWYDVSYSAQAPQAHGLASVPRPLLCCAQCRREPSADVPTLLQCSRCRVVRYCNATCQAAHWPQHKRGCVTPSSP
jgi:hypothetical protein